MGRSEALALESDLARLDQAWATPISPSPSLAAVLGEEFDFFVCVPDSELRFVIDDLLYLYRNDSCFCVPREDVAIGCAVGHYLAGGRPLVIAGMQGLATCIDALTSLCGAANVPLIVLSAWSATSDSGVAHKRPIGSALPELLRAAQLGVSVVEDQAAIPSALVAAREQVRRPSVVLFQRPSNGARDGAR